MNKHLSILALSTLILMGCGQQKKETPVTAMQQPTEVPDKAHNAQNSLDFPGTYQGVLPCADCEGIEIEITLNESNAYVLKTTYLGKKDTKIFEEKGSFTWNNEGNTVTLEGVKDAPNKYFVGESKLIQLDMNGKRIEGNLADKYILKKK